MSRATITEQEVYNAANQLVADNKTVSAASVRGVLGRGSYTTIQAMLEDWKKNHELHPIETRGDLPGSLSSLVSDLLFPFAARLWQLAQSEAEKGLEAEKAELSRDREALHKQTDRAIATAEAQKEHANYLEEQVTTARRKEEDYKDRLVSTRQELDKALAQKREGEELLDEAHTQNERLRADLEVRSDALVASEAHNQALKEELASAQAEGRNLLANNELLKETCSDLKGTITHLHRDIERIENRCTETADQRDTALKTIEAIKDDLNKAREDNALQRQRITDIEHQKALHKEELATMGTQLDAANKAIAKAEAISEGYERQLIESQEAYTTLNHELKDMQQRHAEQTGQLNALTTELRNTQRTLYRMRSDIDQEE